MKDLKKYFYFRFFILFEIKIRADDQSTESHSRNSAQNFHNKNLCSELENCEDENLLDKSIELAKLLPISNEKVRFNEKAYQNALLLLRGEKSFEASCCKQHQQLYLRLVKTVDGLSDQALVEKFHKLYGLPNTSLPSPPHSRAPISQRVACAAAMVAAAAVGFGLWATLSSAAILKLSLVAGITLGALVWPLAITAGIVALGVGGYSVSQRVGLFGFEKRLDISAPFIAPEAFSENLSPDS